MERNYAHSGLTVTDSRIEGLMADFSGLDKLEDIVEKVLQRLALKDNVTQQVAMVRKGNISLQEFDGWFSELVRVELGKTLGIVRNKAVQKAAMNGAGSSAAAVKRRMYRGEYTGNVNIAGGNRRISSRKRIVPSPTGGKSGIVRHRTVKERTWQLREYYGPDRDFILRILEVGRDTFNATSDGPVGRRSMATWGKRGAMAPRNWFFHSMKSDMEQAARQLGQTLTGAVETWVEQQFNEE